MKKFYAQGYYCYIEDHGLIIGDLFSCDLPNTGDVDSIDLNVAFEKIRLFTEASKNSVVTRIPFLLIFQITERTASLDTKDVYSSFVLFQPKDYPNSILIDITEAADSNYSILGHVSRNNAFYLLDALFCDFVSICKELIHTCNRSHVIS